MVGKLGEKLLVRLARFLQVTGLRFGSGKPQESLRRQFLSAVFCGQLPECSGVIRLGKPSRSKFFLLGGHALPVEHDHADEHNAGNCSNNLLAVLLPEDIRLELS